MEVSQSGLLFLAVPFNPLLLFLILVFLVVSAPAVLFSTTSVDLAMEMVLCVLTASLRHPGAPQSMVQLDTVLQIGSDV